MASTTFNGPVRSEKGFQVATKNTATGAITTRMSSGMPDLTGLSISDVATASTLTLSAASETLLTFTPANAATNLFTTGSMIAFICYEDGTYHIASKMGGAADATTGAFVFAS
jgi:hypothetical protein